MTDRWAAASRLVVEGVSYRAAAAECGVSEKQLRTRMKAAGTAPQRRRGQRPAVSDDAVRALWEQGQTQASIAATLGVSSTAVGNALDRLKVRRVTRQVPPTARRAVTPAERDRLRDLAEQVRSRHPMSVELVDCVAELAASGVTQVDIARAAGRSSDWAGRILRLHDRAPAPRPVPVHTASGRAAGGDSASARGNG